MHSTYYSTPCMHSNIGRHLVEVISHATGSDRFSHFYNTANDTPKNFLQFNSTFKLRPVFGFKNTPRYFIPLTQFNIPPPSVISGNNN